MDIIRDILDSNVLDRHGRALGKVDGIVAELRPGRPPVLKAIEVGLPVKARRIAPRLAAILSRWTSVTRIAWSDIEELDMDTKVKLDGRGTPALAFEERLRALLLRIPGA